MSDPPEVHACEASLVTGWRCGHPVSTVSFCSMLVWVDDNGHRVANWDGHIGAGSGMWVCDECRPILRKIRESYQSSHYLGTASERRAYVATLIMGAESADEADAIRRRYGIQESRPEGHDTEATGSGPFG